MQQVEQKMTHINLRKLTKHLIYERKKENFKEHIHAHVRPSWSAHVTPFSQYLEKMRPRIEL